VRLSAKTIPLDPELLGAAERLAAREGVLHSTARSLFAGFGPLRSVELAPLGSLASPSPAVAALGAISVDPRAERTPRCHLALPFDPAEAGVGVIPELQVTATAESCWMLAIGPPDELDAKIDDAVHMLEAVRAADRSPVMVTSLDETPSAERYGASVAAAVEQIRSGRLAKVVLARSIQLLVERPLDPAAVTERMAEREPTCTRYATSITDGGRLVGASPELVLSISGGQVTSHPLAGTLLIEAANDDPATLLTSGKDLDEHRLLVDDLAASLRPLVEDLAVPEGPSIVTLRSVAHLGTLLAGSLRGGPGAIEPIALLEAILPTPAVGGVPRAAALALIAELEGPRRDYFAGCLGWLDLAGDAEFVLGIRGAALRGRSCTITAGAGIVADSTPRGEAIETRSKLASVLETVAPAGSSLLSRP
jgi:isochorismate synthase